MNRNAAESLPKKDALNVDPTRSSDIQSVPISAGDRLHCLDAYRGAIMISLAFSGFGLAETAKRHLTSDPGNAFWSNVFFQFEHVEWQGCGYWDLIQPSFMFMVGVSMAYSYLKREAMGHSYARMFGHAATRAIVLVLLGVFLSSNGNKSTNWSFMNVLSQIGLGYTVLFLMWRRGFVAQLTSVALLLVATWIMYVGHGGQAISLEDGDEAVGVSAEWAKKHLTDVDPAWHKNSNVGHAVDKVVLNWFRRPSAFEFNSGGYQTINFIPSLATMILGLICGQWLRSNGSDMNKLGRIAALGLLCGLAGWGLAESGLVPLVKRIWTPSWALFSTGLCCLILASLYLVTDIWKLKGWAFPLVVVGTNSIAMYLMSQMLKPWVGRTLQTHLGQEVFSVLGESWEPFVRANLVGMAFWLTCLFLYRQRIFFRI
jgi:heparan-alpha-glucosaminide N-acetyltransferase